MNAAEFLDEYWPFRRGELALVRKLDDDPYFLPPLEADALRYALRLAQLSSTGLEPGDLEGRIGYFRLRLLQLLAPVLPTDPDRLESAALAAALPRVVRFVDEARARIVESGTARAEQLDREVGTKRLALVLGGAGGSGYIYLGALQRLAELGIEPAYMVGCSIGSLLAIVRGRRRDFDLDELLEEISRLRARALFRAPSPLARFGLPAALRLDLRPAIGDVFTDPDGGELRLRDLAIPVDTLATGVGRGALSRPMQEFAAGVDPGPPRLTDIDASALGRAVSALVALAMSRSVVAPVVLGADADTAQLPALDAAGFSAAIPALLHYDVPPDAARSIAILDRLFEERDLVALVDGVLVSTLPARHAWESIEAGRIGTRNCAIVALDALVPQRGVHALLDPIQRVVAATAHRDKPFWDLRVVYRRVPGMLELFPAPRLLRAAIANGEREFESTARLLRGLLAAVPPWDTLRERLSAQLTLGAARPE